MPLQGQSPSASASLLVFITRDISLLASSCNVRRQGRARSSSVSLQNGRPLPSGTSVLLVAGGADESFNLPGRLDANASLGLQDGEKATCPTTCSVLVFQGHHHPWHMLFVPPSVLNRLAPNTQRNTRYFFVFVRSLNPPALALAFTVNRRRAKQDTLGLSCFVDVCN